MNNMKNEAIKKAVYKLVLNSLLDDFCVSPVDLFSSANAELEKVLIRTLIAAITDKNLLVDFILSSFHT